MAITRAREELFLYHAESRMIFGMTNRNRISRFAEEVPEELVERTRSREYAYRSGVTMPSFSGQGGASRGAEGAPASAGGRPGRTAQTGGFAAQVYQPHPVKPAPAGTYKAGDTVEHKTFGAGLVLTATPMANDTLLEIAFDKVGTKKLFANFARLKKL